MHTSSYLEAFLSVYGWMMYNTLYELFAMTWLLFLPFMKLGFLTFIDTLSDSANRYGQFKKGIITFVLMIFALFLAVVPLDAIKIEGTTVLSHCKKESGQIKGNVSKMKEFYGFDVTSEGKVPLFPSLIMRIAAGTNNVIYQTIPCALSVRDFAMVIKTTEITDKGLREEVGRFNQECATPARDRMRRIAADAPIAYNAIFFYKNFFGGEESNISDQQKEFYPGNKLFQLMMTGDTSEIENLIPSQEREKFFNALPKGNALYSASAVADVESDDQDMSQQQQANNTGTVKCTDWWNKKLFPALKKNVNKDIVLKLAKDEFFRNDCYKSPPKNAITYGNPTFGIYGDQKSFDEKACQAAIDKAIEADDAFSHSVVFRAIYNTNNSSLALQAEDRKNIEGIGVLGVVGTILGSFVGMGDDILSNIVGNAVSFYAQMFFYRVILQMLQPMLLMGIFTFWGIYLIVADYRWETILKGLILIFIISILPGLWSISQHLDNALWQALYPEITSIKDLANRGNGSYVERILLDAASTVFNIIFPLILMYLVNEAGGGRPGEAISTSSRGAEQVSSSGGRIAGNSASGAVNTAKKGIEGLRDWRNARRDKANLPPGGSRY